jgi:hypothetical protein
MFWVVTLCSDGLIIIIVIKFLSESLKGRAHIKDKGIDERIILEWILGNRVGSCAMDSSGSGYGPVAGCREHGNVPLGSIKGGKFLD